MTCQNYCLAFVFFGLFLVFQSTSVDTVENSEEISDVLINPVCPLGCASCSTYNGCVTCYGTHFLLLRWYGIRQTGQCVRKCPTGFYGRRVRGHGKCFACELENCEACSNQTTCSSCIAPLFAANGRCVSKCPKSRPHPTEKRVCQKRINCEVGPWSQWGLCVSDNTTCASEYGCKTRRRQILQKPSPNGRKCPKAVQRKTCKRQLCECPVEIENESAVQLGESLKEFSEKQRKCGNQNKECKEKNRNKERQKSQKSAPTTTS